MSDKNTIVNSNIDSDLSTKTENTSEILDLLPKETPNNAQQIPSAEAPKAASASLAASLPFPELPGLGTKWLPTTDKKILDTKHKTFLEHTKLLASGTPVEQIPHAKFGYWRGCQCVEDKTKRNEKNSGTIVEPGSQPTSKAISTKVTEKLLANLLDLPNKTFKMFATSKKLPQEAVDCWNTPQEDLQVYGECGKAILDEYLPDADFKHKTLVVFSIVYLGGIAVRFNQMNQILQEQRKADK